MNRPECPLLPNLTPRSGRKLPSRVPCAAERAADRHDDAHPNSPGEQLPTCRLAPAGAGSNFFEPLTPLEAWLE